MFYCLFAIIMLSLFSMPLAAMESPRLQWRTEGANTTAHSFTSQHRDSIYRTHNYTGMLETYLQTQPSSPLPMLRSFQFDVIQKALKTKNERTAIAAVGMLNTQLTYLAWLSAHMTQQEEENLFRHLNQQFDVVDRIRKNKEVNVSAQERTDLRDCAMTMQTLLDAFGLPATEIHKQLEDEVIQRKIDKANNLKKFNLTISQKTELKLLLAANFKTVHSALLEDFESGS